MDRTETMRAPELPENMLEPCNGGSSRPVHYASTSAFGPGPASYSKEPKRLDGVVQGSTKQRILLAVVCRRNILGRQLQTR